MMLALLAFAFLSSVTLLVRADNAFLFPPSSGQNVTLGSKVVVSWTTDWGPVPISLEVYQKDESGWAYSPLLGRCDLKGFCELS